MLRVALIVVALGLALTPPAVASHGYDLDCSDFGNQQAAQDHYTAHPGDPDGLDADGNGRACESLPCPCAGSASPTPTPAPTATPEPTPSPVPMTRQARVLRVIDGDTITVRLTDQRRVTVRLLGIDTPELSTGGSPVECGAWDAKAGLERLLLSRQGGGRLVRLITDPTQDERDTYGRWLAYVERVADDLDAGRRLVRSGWSRAYIYDDDFERLPAYRAAEQAARDAFRGGWSLCAGDFHLPFRPRTRNCAAPYIMYVDRVSCAWARGQIARLKRGGRGPRGWACSSGSRFRTGGYCQRGNRVFGWHPAD